VKPERIARMPGWPARMDVDMAADYLGISASSLRDKVERGEYPQPVREGVRKLWSKVQLDRFIAAQFGLPLDGIDGGGASRGTWDDL
jgi:predicted DNA-binding transcriptional regulator AlpA